MTEPEDGTPTDGPVEAGPLEEVMLEHLERISTVHSSIHFNLRRVVQTMTDAATELSGAEFGAFVYKVADDAGSAYTVYTEPGASRDAFDELGLPQDSSSFEPTFRRGGTVRVDDVRVDPRFDHLASDDATAPDDLRVRSYLAVPVVGVGDKILGGLFLGHSKTGMFTDQSAAAAEAVAGHAAVAIENGRRYTREHNVSLTLQHSLLPESLPVVPGLRLAARYCPAADHIEVGGDWYDAVALPDGRVGISVGDVVGHDVLAAAKMGQVRGAVRALMLENPEPANLLVHLERFMQVTGLEVFTTVVYGILDPAEQSLKFICAGHPAPALVAPDGRASYLPATTVGPVGVGLISASAADRAETTARLPEGSTLFLYTDGLVERRGASIDDGCARLLDALRAAAPATPDALCDHVLETMSSNGDDIVVLAMAVDGAANEGAAIDGAATVGGA